MSAFEGEAIKKLLAALAGLLRADTPPTPPGGLDHGHAIHLDAEDLAESGMRTAYERLNPALTGEEGAAWGRATHAFFDIVNSRLENAPVRFRALNGGNDLFGIFLTDATAEAARNALPRQSHWPHLPTPDHPYYGEYH